MKGPALFQGEIIKEIVNYFNEILKNSYFPESLGQFQANLTQSVLGSMEFKFLQIKVLVLF